MPPDRKPSETSPLLGPTTGNPSFGAIAGQEESGEAALPTEDQAKEPSPNVQKQLRYIIPAISIGVSCFVLLYTLCLDHYDFG